MKRMSLQEWIEAGISASCIKQPHRFIVHLKILPADGFVLSPARCLPLNMSMSMLSAGGLQFHTGHRHFSLTCACRGKRLLSTS